MFGGGDVSGGLGTVGEIKVTLLAIVLFQAEVQGHQGRLRADDRVGHTVGIRWVGSGVETDHGRSEALVGVRTPDHGRNDAVHGAVREEVDGI